MMYTVRPTVTMRLTEGDIDEIKNGYIVAVTIDGIDYRLVKQQKE